MSVVFPQRCTRPEGKFRKFEATVAFDPAKPEATQVQFEVDLASIAPGKYEARGTLMIKGVSQSVVAPFTLAESARVRVVECQFALRRPQFKIGEGSWADTETVADEVLVRFRFALPSTR